MNATDLKATIVLQGKQRFIWLWTAERVSEVRQHIETFLERTDIQFWPSSAWLANEAIDELMEMHATKGQQDANDHRS